MLQVTLIILVLVLVGESWSEDSSNFTYNNKYFPDQLKFGVATSAFQVEGAWNEDGKGVHLWDWYVHTYPELIKDNSTADVACDSYHKWEVDVQLLRDLKVDHYRLSLSWSRILPNGTVNMINQKGVDYYLSLFKALNESNIKPVVTLVHFDIPYVFHEKGGWQNPLLSDYFAEYARLCFRLFGDYVKAWITINEAHSTCANGYVSATKAPGYQLPAKGMYQCTYVTLLAHAKAYRIYDKEFRPTQKGKVSIVFVAAWYIPASDDPNDVLAVENENEFKIGLWAHPIFLGNWPERVVEIVSYRSKLEGFSKSRLPELTPEEIDLINGTADFFCVNTYSSNYVSLVNNMNESIGEPNYYLDRGTVETVDESWLSELNYIHLVPWGFRKLLNYVYEKYNHPEIFVSENGWGDETGVLNDTNRILYIKQYLSALLDAYYEDGVNIIGYTVWTLMDNFEWLHGYTGKLGLVSVNFDSDEKERTPRQSYYWYQDIINRKCLVEQCET